MVLFWLLSWQDDRILYLLRPPMARNGLGSWSMIASDRSGAGRSIETARTKAVVADKTVSWGFE